MSPTLGTRARYAAAVAEMMDLKQDLPFWSRLTRTLCRTIGRTGLFALTCCSVSEKPVKPQTPTTARSA